MYGLGIAQPLKYSRVFCRFTGFMKMQLIDLTSRWKVRFRQTFFQNEVQRVLMLHKLVLVTDDFHHSKRIKDLQPFKLPNH